MYRDGTLTDDDEVAVLHGPEEMGYVQITEAMVNVRATLDQAVKDATIGQTAALAVMRSAKWLYYKERTFPAAISASAESVPGTTLCQLLQWSPKGRIDQKRLDTFQMLGAILARLTQRAATAAGRNQPQGGN
jgi:hypothetical protein